MSGGGPGGFRRPRAPQVGPRGPRALPRKQEFRAFAVVLDDRIVLRTPYNADLVADLKQIPAKLRLFVKDGRQLERTLQLTEFAITPHQAGPQYCAQQQGGCDRLYLSRRTEYGGRLQLFQR